MSKITLKAARYNAGMTQENVRSALHKMGFNVAISTISSWEQEKTFPSVQQFKALCELYNCKMDDIFVPEMLTLK